jgi:hypothetical protein
MKNGLSPGFHRVASRCRAPYIDEGYPTVRYGPGNPGLLRLTEKFGGGLINENGEAVRRHRRTGYDDVWKYRALEREWRYVSGTQLVFIQTVLAPPYPKCIIL